jgi:hypothetical protein
MANITNTAHMPKDMKKHAGVVKELDLNDPNDWAFQLVTMFVFFCVAKLTFFYSEQSICMPSHPPN